MRNALALVILSLALSGCGADVPVSSSSNPITFVDCPSGWWGGQWQWACYPSTGECNYTEHRMYWIVGGRLVERRYEEDATQRYASFWTYPCLDRSPWPTGWTGSSKVYDFGEFRKTYAWKHEWQQSDYPGCHCYTNTDGINWNERTCYGWECF
jgi:hypothetical protein